MQINDYFYYFTENTKKIILVNVGNILVKVPYTCLKLSSGCHIRNQHVRKPPSTDFRIR